MNPVILFLAYAVILIAAMYVFVYIPNKKKQRRQQALHKSLAPGDEVVTLGGIVGTVAELDGEYVELIIDGDKDVRMRVILYAITQLKSSHGG